MARRYEQCNSYYVESYNRHEVLGCERNDKAIERHIKKQQQLAMADELEEIARVEYLDDHVLHMEEMELATLPDVASIDIQSEIQWYMRPYLLDFLNEAHAAFDLLPETLFLTINILDRYCSKRVVYRKHYQLVGVTSLLLAAKYGDHKEKVPTVIELKKMCCHLYEEYTFTEMEWHVLQTLDWVIGHPTIDSFLKLTRDGVMYDVEAEHMACYISEMALFHKDFVSKRPSDIARASLDLSRMILGRRREMFRTQWEHCYEHGTFNLLSKLVTNKPSMVLALKYASSNLSRVSITLDTFVAEHHAANRAYHAPPTPPSGMVLRSDKSTVPVNESFSTPQKNYPPNMPHGCPTPPITPVCDDSSHGLGFPRPPPLTPTPMRSRLISQSTANYYPGGLSMMN